MAGIKKSIIKARKLTPDGGLEDARLGSVACKSCGHNSKQCPGHFGMIKFPTIDLSYLRPGAMESIGLVSFRTKELVYSNKIQKK